MGHTTIKIIMGNLEVDMKSGNETCLTMGKRGQTLCLVTGGMEQGLRRLHIQESISGDIITTSKAKNKPVSKVQERPESDLAKEVEIIKKEVKETKDLLKKIEEKIKGADTNNYVEE